MASPNVARRSATTELSGLLDSPEIGRLIAELEATRWTGRPGWPIRTMVGLALAKSVYALPTWTKVVALVAEVLWLLLFLLAPDPGELTLDPGTLRGEPFACFLLVHALDPIRAADRTTRR